MPGDRPFEVVVTTNSGFPLDQNLYQAVKGMSAANQIVADGGAIVAAAECSDRPAGIRQLQGHPASWATRPRQLLDLIISDGFHMHDQWQVQVQAQIQRRARPSICAPTASPTSRSWQAHLERCEDVAATAERLPQRRRARIAVLPQAPDDPVRRRSTPSVRLSPT